MGELPAGTPVRQDHIASEFKASHVPVREAFRVLEGQGLLVSVPRCGVRVAALDPSAVREVTEMRASLETLALRHAIPMMTNSDFEVAAMALEEGEESREIVVWEAANRRFHRAITSPCAMPRLVSTLGDLHDTSARFLFATWQGLGWHSRSDREHRDIFGKARDGDIEGAVTALDQHIRAAGHALIESLEKQTAQRATGG